jgi:riboflavin synthase
MFTGIVTDIGEIEHVEERGALHRLAIRCSYPLEGIALGASIACSGTCLTVVATRGATGEPGGSRSIGGLDREPLGSQATIFEVDAAAETLAITTVGQWGRGTRINLERALKIGDELGGHIVTGHIDGLARLVSREDFDGMARLVFEAPRALSRFIAPKGSVALDGISLTVNEVEGDRFGVLIIPHTLKVTTLGERKVGDSLNIEVDLMARYAARLTEAR